MKKQGNIKLFVIASYVLFIILLLITGGIMLGLQNELLTAIAKNVCSWTPTFVVLLFLPRLKPDVKRGDFFRQLFKGRFSAKSLLFVIVLQVAAFLGSVLLFSITGHVPVNELLQLSAPTLGYAFINSLTSGATGEEAGWRGYLQPAMVEKYGLIKGSVFVGIIWAFWHTPLWFISGEYTGLDLVKYIVLFVTFVIATSVIIGICYQKSKNLLIPITIHFFVNFTMAFIRSNMLGILVYLAIFYVILVAGYILWQKRQK